MENILDEQGYLALLRDRHLPVNWSIDHDYMLSSTIYLFGRYFCWVELMHRNVNFEIFHSQKDFKAFFDGIYLVSKQLSSWPLDKSGDPGSDRQVFVLQQIAIGDAFIIRRPNEPPDCIGYKEFLALRAEPVMAEILAPLEMFLDSLDGETVRWTRLERTRKSLNELKDHAAKLLAVVPQH